MAGVMDRDFLQLEPDADLAEVLPLMAQAGRCALVMEGAETHGSAHHGQSIGIPAAAAVWNGTVGLGRAGFDPCPNVLPRIHRSIG